MNANIARQRLVARLQKLVAAAQSGDTSMDFEAELANELQSTSGWWVNQVEDKMLDRQALPQLTADVD